MIMESYSLIGRIAFYRSIRKKISFKKLINIQIFVASDTYEVLSNIIQDCNIECTISTCMEENLQWTTETFVDYRKTIKNNVASITISGLCSGKYKLTFMATPARKDILIIPVTSETFEVVEYDLNSSFVSPTLRCERNFFSHHTNQIIMSEECGKSLGSHVYDCAIILNRFLDQVFIPQVITKSTSSLFKSFNQINSNDQQQNYTHPMNRHNEMDEYKGIIIELGAGCGLNGIWLSHFYHASILTDKDNEQLDMIRNNIMLNNRSNCLLYKLDWTNANDIQCFTKDSSHQAIDLIIASDVLYASDLHQDFFNLLKRLAMPTTEILIAQKIRQHCNYFDEELLANDFLFEEVYHEANVIIWKFHLK